MNVRYVEQIEGSPVVQFVAQAWCALMRAGQWEGNSVLVSPELQCVFALDGRRIVGCKTFHVDEDGQAVGNIAYVLPAYRGKGVYRALHDRFIAEAKNQGAKTALVICHPDNTGIREACAKLGYKPREIHLHLPI